MKLIKKLARDEIALVIKEWIEKEGFPYDEASLFEPIFEAGFKKALEMAIDRVQYSRFSIALQDHGFTRGYIRDCQDIKERVEKVGEEEV